MGTETALRSFLTRCRERVDRVLDEHLPAEAINPSVLHRAMRYSVFNGGKRVRPSLVYATAEALALAMSRVDAPACAVELIHCYSLIHDDLPAMDDDDLRRGRPSCHKAFGEADALLAGDALQTLAFQVLSSAGAAPGEAAPRLRMVEMLAQASGSRGMAGGQAIDLAAVGEKLDLASLENMHIHKTGALIRCSVLMAALYAPDVDAAVLRGLDRYAKCIGLAFQIRDDILDVEGDTEVLGKHSGQDREMEKPTYVSLLGLQEAKKRTRELHLEALHNLSPLDQRADCLRGIADYIVGRDF